LNLRPIQSSYLELLNSTLCIRLKEIFYSVNIIGTDRLNWWIERHLVSPFQYSGCPVTEQIWKLLIYMLEEWGKPLSKDVM